MTHPHLQHSGKCRGLIERCIAYLDGELEGQDLDQVLKLMNECDCCRRCIEELKLTKDLIKQLPQPEMKDDIKDRLKACLKKHE